MYAAPSDYVYDPETNLYYEYATYKDESGKDGYIVNWFNPETGEFIQKTYPMDGPKKKKPGNGKIIIAIIAGIALMVATYLYVNMDATTDENEAGQENVDTDDESGSSQSSSEGSDSSEGSSGNQGSTDSSGYVSSSSGAWDDISFEELATQVDLEFALDGEEYYEEIYESLINAISSDFYLDVEYTFNELGIYQMEFETEEGTGVEVGYYELDGNILTIESEVYGTVTYAMYLDGGHSIIMYAIVLSPELVSNEFWARQPYGEGLPDETAEIGVTYYTE